MHKRLLKAEPKPKNVTKNEYQMCLREITSGKFSRAVLMMQDAVCANACLLADAFKKPFYSSKIPELVDGLQREGIVSEQEANRLAVLLMVMDGLEMEVFESGGTLTVEDARYLREFVGIVKRILLGQASAKPQVPYWFLRDHLASLGFSVYPREMVCGSVGCPFEKNRLVDVAAEKDGKFWAFEYKSVGDGLMRAVKQAENYRRSFDYVVLVAEVPRYDFSLNPTRGIRIKEFFMVGAGLWTVNLSDARPEFAVVREPLPQNPVPQNHAWIELKFHHNLKILSKQAVNNKKLSDYVTT